MYVQDINDYEQIQVLQEMFPGLCEMEVRHCLTIAGGDIATAAQVVLHRQEAGQALNQSSIIQVFIFIYPIYLFVKLFCH